MKIGYKNGFGRLQLFGRGQRLRLPDDLINDLETFGLLFETLCVRDLRVKADIFSSAKTL